MKIFILLLWTSVSWASLIPNNIEITTEDKSDFVSSRFLAQIESFKNFYSPWVIERGGELVMVTELDNDSVNASASREGNKWFIKIKGGLLKHRRLNEDVFISILCHELGHHLGGAPFKFPESEERGWVSVEGQSDYYATNICLKAYYENENHSTYLKKNPPKKIMLDKCQGTPNYNLCLRMAVMAEKTGLFIGQLGQTRRGRRGGRPNINTPDLSQVRSTTIQHPKSQCRMDTYFQGALCHRYFTLGNPNCLKNEKGARPGCWLAF